ncbi:MBL fold metallo-hydrolase [Miltoncostaea marina]|uniref:MBL fold metallo-hydrolase n=1 Tax=Miltoncostaea marina TaxID=2843215 RepID=UPI001C3D1003|nr:MBL fold metallo-hydrolase [Miltoncostaea marina]
MQGTAPGITTIDTRLGGMTGVMAAHLVAAPRPAIVDPGPRTSAPVVREALERLGMGPDDLAWIVLTHVHLDHCGSTGILARAFPRARVVVHRRGARHLAEPARLVAGSVAVYGRRWSLYGLLDRTPADRIDAAEDGHRVPLGDGRDLVMLETPGHARHHMSVLEEGEGAVFAGDAAGVRFPGSGLYPALPPPDIDPEAGDRSLARLADLRPGSLMLGHFGAVADPLGDIDLARRQLAAAAAAVRRHGPGPGLGEAIARALPLEPAVASPAGLARWRALGWAEANVDGLAGWAAAAAAADGPAEPSKTGGGDGTVGAA